MVSLDLISTLDPLPVLTKIICNRKSFNVLRTDFFKIDLRALILIKFGKIDLRALVLIKFVFWTILITFRPHPSYSKHHFFGQIWVKKW